MKAYVRKTRLSVLLIFSVSIIIVVGVFLDGPLSEDKIPASIELVMTEGASIKVVGADATLHVSAQGGLKRTYEWDECNLSTTLRARASRWYGSLGAYDPGFSFGLWGSECNGASRTVVQEGQIHFDDENFANEWINRKPKFYNTAWSTNGLLVSWAISPSRSQLNVNVWLMCLDGKPFNFEVKPSKFRIFVSSIHEGHPIRRCKRVDNDAINDTRHQIREFWAEIERLYPKPKHMNDMQKLKLLNQ